MTAYGFRIWRINLRRGNGQKDMPFTSETENGTWSYLSYLHQILVAHTDKRMTGLPRPDITDLDEESQELESQQEEPLFKVLSVDPICGSTLRAVIRYGRPSGHQTAMPQDLSKADVDITGLAPARDYRVVLVAPKGSGTTALLAVEAVSRACPYRPLVAWAKKWSQEKAVADDAGHSLPWWRLRPTPMGDIERLTLVMAAAQADQVVLRGATRRKNRLRATDDMTAQFGLNAHGAQRAVTAKAKTWAEQIIRGEKINVEKERTEVAALLGMPEDDFVVDDAKITVTDSDGIVRHVSPTSLSDLFTYHIDDKSPDNVVFRARVRGAVERLARQVDLSPDWTGWSPGRS